jgi:tetratricopeptide (TPR) repeat protein
VQYIAPSARPLFRALAAHESIGFMKHARPTPFIIRQAIQGFVLALMLAAIPATADEYSDVSQLIRAGNMAGALLKADQLLATRPRDPQMRFLKGTIQQASGKPDEALATFAGLTEDYPELPEPHNNLAVLYAARNEFDKARAELEMAIRTNPNYAVAHENLADVYAKLASLAYSRSLELGAASASVTPKLALIREAIGTKASPAPAPVKASTATPATVPPAPPSSTSTTPKGSIP